MLGFAKSFVIVIFIAAIVGYGMKDWKIFWSIIAVFALVRIVWKFLT